MRATDGEIVLSTASNQLSDRWCTMSSWRGPNLHCSLGQRPMPLWLLRQGLGSSPQALDMVVGGVKG